MRVMRGVVESVDGEHTYAVLEAWDGNTRSTFQVVELTDEPEPIVLAQHFTANGAWNMLTRKVPGQHIDKGCDGVEWV